MRKISYITGTRADFGLMRSTLQAIESHPELTLSILVTGMHLLPAYGETWKEIAENKLPIYEKIVVQLSGHSGEEMSIAVGKEIIEFTKTLKKIKPDILLLLGDRGEMLAGAIAAVHLNIPIVHIHGGELSGTIDDSVRHAITKLSHYHFTSTEGARQRLIKMGEIPEHIHVTGAPGLDGITELVVSDRIKLLTEVGLNPDLPIALFLFHPVVQQSNDAGSQITVIIEALNEIEELQVLALMPNADAGGEAIAKKLLSHPEKFYVRTHLPRNEFVNWMANVDVMIGNSSSGIIEAATFGTPVINIGSRQYGREHGSNVQNVNIDMQEIKDAVLEKIKYGRDKVDNLYGDGNAGKRIVELLATLPLNSDLLLKHNAY